MKLLRRFVAWLNEPEPGPKLVYTVDDMLKARYESYTLGTAHGELQGRMSLAREIERMFPETGEGMSKDDATLVRLRQVH